MSLDSKRPEADRPAQEPASLTGESVTEAVTGAVQERREQGSLADHLVALGEDCAARLKEPYRNIEHADLLYDERGLPR